MPTKISFQTWSGGSGCGDPSYLIGYCKESPEEVLEKVYENYYIYHYKDLYRPVDYNYPNNVEGLIIQEITEDDLKSTMSGCKVVIEASINDLDLNRAYAKNVNRTTETFINALENCKKWSLSESLMRNNPKCYNKHLKDFEEVERIILKTR